MKRFKAFTLVELIVAMAIFGIIMVGIMNLAQPITNSSATAKVLNNQKNVEEATVSYIGESLRYATNLLIIEEGAEVGIGTSSKVTVTNANEAVQAFLNMGPVDAFGDTLLQEDGKYFNGTDAKEPSGADIEGARKKLSVIVFDGTIGQYNYVNNNYNGRLLSKVDGKTNLVIGDAVAKVNEYDATMYEVFGNDYYGPSDITLNVKLTNGGLMTLSCSSEYYMSNGQKKGAKKNSDTSSNPTVGTYELRNMGKGNYKFALASKDDSKTYIATDRSGGGRIYFVYTTNVDGWATDSTVIPKWDPNNSAHYHDARDGDTKGASFKTSGGEAASSATPTNNSGSNSGNSGSNSGNSGSNSGNSGSNSGGEQGGEQGGEGDPEEEKKEEPSTPEPEVPTPAAATGRNGAAAPPASTNASSTVNVVYHAKTWAGDTEKSLNLNYDSSIWKATVSEDGRTVTFESTTYGKVIFKGDDWGNPTYVYDTGSENQLHIKGDWPNNQDCQQVSSSNTTAIDFWKTYGIQFNF